MSIFDDAEAAFAAPEPKAKPAAQASPGKGAPAPKKERKPSKSADEKAAEEAKLQAAADALQDGIHFGLPMELYRRIRALGSGSLADIAISPATFWARSWLNPDKADEEESSAQVLGSAYHCARLEPDYFFDRYARELDKEEELAALGEDGEACFTGTDMSAALAELGQAKTKAGEGVLGQARRLRDAGFAGMIWPLRMEEWENDRGGRIPLRPQDWEAIQLDMERLRSNPEIAELLTGGAAEVTIIWTDKHGLRCKCRPDYLKAASWVDFKTFANSQGKRLEQCLADAFRYNRYHMQWGHYFDGMEAIREGGLQIQGEASDAERKLIASIQIRPEELECTYLFQEKGGIPNLLARRLEAFDVPLQTRINDAGASEAQIAAAHRATRTRTPLFIRAQADLERSKRDFHLYSQVYEPGRPWAPIEPMGTFSNMDFNSYWLEGKND